MNYYKKKTNKLEKEKQAIQKKEMIYLEKKLNS